MLAVLFNIVFPYRVTEHLFHLKDALFKGILLRMRGILCLHFPAFIFMLKPVVDLFRKVTAVPCCEETSFIKSELERCRSAAVGYYRDKTGCKDFNTAPGLDFGN